MPRQVLTHLLHARRQAPGFLWLIDPEKTDAASPDPRWEMASDFSASRLFSSARRRTATAISNRPSPRCRERTDLPLILFSGSAAQVSPHVDAVLFLTLLSGRNPEYLVGEQVKGTPKIRDYGIEPIPTGYILVDTGSAAQTSVALRSHTDPIPERELTTISGHPLCGEYMGHTLIYIEAGSGAKRPVAVDTIRKVKAAIGVPLIVGGGMKTAIQCASAVKAGSDFVVVGTALEHDASTDLLRDMVHAVHSTGKAVNV